MNVSAVPLNQGSSVIFKRPRKIDTYFLIIRLECLKARGNHCGAVADLTNWGPEATTFRGPSTSALPKVQFIKIFQPF